MNNIEIARKAERETLNWLLRFGWLTTRQIAALMYDAERHKSFDIALRWTQTMLKRMKTKNWVASVKEPFRDTRHALAAKGCRELEVSVALAKDALRYDSVHREACNWMAIRFELTCRVNPGWQMWTEQEIQKNLAPFKAHGEKVPDGLLLTHNGFVWLEMETCRRSKKDMVKLMNWLITAVGRYPFDKEKRQFRVVSQAVCGKPIHQVLVVLATDTAATFGQRLEAISQATAAREEGFTSQDKLNMLWTPANGCEHTRLRILSEDSTQAWYPLPCDKMPAQRPIGPLEQKYRRRMMKLTWE